jgi:histidyl-tRNA synthetase
MPTKKKEDKKIKPVKAVKKPTVVKAKPVKVVKSVKVAKFVKRPNKPEVKKEVGVDEERNSSPWKPLRGMRDILPKQEKYWQTLYDNAKAMATYFHFGRIETPILEEAKLFLRTLGKNTDIVSKEMYVFEQQEESGKICLRPEATASVMRAYIANGLWNQSQPVKMWYWGPMFRHDRPQAGRYRQFYQVGYEIIGANDPIMDAELILVAYNFYKDLGLPVTIQINSIGLPEERERYANELVSYYRTKRSYLCESCRQRLIKNPLRLLDCKEDQCQPIKDGAPQILDWLTESSKSYFMKVLEYLDDLEVPYVLQPNLVRGLDYYTHTVFEVFPALENDDDKNLQQLSQIALGGGGRYDLLGKEMAGRETPASGMALGVDRSIMVLKEYAKNHEIKISEPKMDIFFAQLGERAKGQALKLINNLKQSGLKIGFNLYKNSLKTQLESANAMAVPYALILGQKEMQDGTIIIRDMESGIQEIVDQKKIEVLIKKKLSSL